MSKDYIDPGNVVSPKKFWILAFVLLDEGPGKTAIACGRWEGKPVLVIRNNGTKKNPLGNPKSRGFATWFRIPDKFNDAFLSKLPKEKQDLFNLFMSVCN